MYDIEPNKLQSSNMNLEDHRELKPDGSYIIRERWSSRISNNEISRCRRWFKMRSIKSGKRSCLKCDRDFDSPDVSLIKMCESCKYLTRSMT